MREPIKLAVVDDNAFFRKGLMAFLKSYKDFKIIIEASNGKELIDALVMQKPDIILLDLEMPIKNGIETTEYLSEYYPSIKIIILTVHNDEKTSFNLLEKGAHGFLSKENSTDKLLDAIYMVNEHCYYFSGWDLKKIINTKKTEKKVSLIHVKFTDRELEIIELICRQYTNKEISGKLFISPRTVDNYRDKILQKTNTRNTAGLVVYAMQNDLVIINREKDDNARHRKNR